MDISALNHWASKCTYNLIYFEYSRHILTIISELLFIILILLLCSIPAAAAAADTADAADDTGIGISQATIEDLSNKFILTWVPSQHEHSAFYSYLIYN